MSKIAAAAVGNTRNDMYLVSEAIRFLMKDKESDVESGKPGAAETVWRQHNMVNDIGTAFATFSPLYNEHEFHGTARQSRISLLIEGNIDPYQKLSGYDDSDFLGVGNTSNYNQTMQCL
jgi:hypothetical protein